MDAGTIALAVTLLISIIGNAFGVKKVKWFKQVAKNVVNTAEEVINAVEDDKVSEEEVKRVANRGKAVLAKEKKEVEK